jgi:hypothetical protein
VPKLLSLLNLRRPVVDTVPQMLDIGSMSGFFGTVTEFVRQIQVLYFQESAIDIAV